MISISFRKKSKKKQVSFDKKNRIAWCKRGYLGKFSIKDPKNIADSFKIQALCTYHYGV